MDDHIPIQDTICAADSALSTPDAIADRGGDPALWPAHVKRAIQDA